jgi:hypothetical protein
VEQHGRIDLHHRLERVGELAERPVDERADEADLDLGERPVCRRVAAVTAEHEVDRREREAHGELKEGDARKRRYGQHRQMRRVRRVPHELVVGDLVDRTHRHRRHRTHGARQQRRHLARERLVHDQQVADLVARELVGLAEVERANPPSGRLGRGVERHRGWHGAMFGDHVARMRLGATWHARPRPGATA